MKVRAFVSSVDHARVVAAIKEAEARSTGEVRVHVSSRLVDDAQRAAAEVFERLGMTATQLRNGVLIYIAPRRRRFAVIGDREIHARCGEAFWREVTQAMEGDFRAGRFTEGIVKGVEKAGDQLAAHFPRKAGVADVNELPDEVSHD